MYIEINLGSYYKKLITFYHPKIRLFTGKKWILLVKNMKAYKYKYDNNVIIISI
ncbi:unnamed protein product [marine sediment metagenome]|uniref:Uncharacterized protein n=1 Tax=marine sediment metagenome TaxID=412755 RepID=X0WEI7_9ZZZZ